PLVSVLVTHQLEGLAGGDGDQQMPEVLAVVQPREAATFGATAEAIEGAEGYVFLVGDPPRRSLELFAGQPDQPLKVAFPEGLGGGVVAGLEPVDPVADRSIRRHGAPRGFV